MRPPQLIFDPEGLYARLGVEPSASPEAIVAAFRRQARVLHPDIAGTGDADAFVAVKLAYDVLANPERRASYGPERCGTVRSIPVSHGCRTCRWLSGSAWR